MSMRFPSKELIWHFYKYKDTNDLVFLFWKKKGLFIEWKYFNGYSENLKYLICYTYPDPDKELKLLPPEVYIRIYRPEKEIVYNHKTFPDSKIDWDTKKSIDIRYDTNNFVDQIDKQGNEIRLRGELDNVSWDLTYKRDKLDLVHKFKDMDLSSEIFGYSLQKIFSQTMDWQIIMPRARVTGYLKVGNDKYEINEIKDLIGYIDSNWGKWIPIGPMWKWGQCSGVTGNGETYAFLIGDIYNRKNRGQMYVETNSNAENRNNLIIFDKAKILNNGKKQYKIKASNWFKDLTTGILVPMHHKIEANKGKQSLKIITNTKYYDVFPIEIPSPIAPDFYVIQMHVNYTGGVFENGNKILDINSEGFMEHTGLNYKTIPQKVVNAIKKIF